MNHNKNKKIIKNIIIFLLFLMLIIIIILLFIIYKLSYYQNNNKDDDIKLLLRQTSRWAIASQQDKSPMIAILHANYAVGYLMALQDIVSENEINKYTNLNNLRNKLLRIQDNAVLKTVKECPQYASYINKELALLGMQLI